MSNQEAIKNIEKIIQEENIECDFEKRFFIYIYTRCQRTGKNKKRNKSSKCNWWKSRI